MKKFFGMLSIVTLVAILCICATFTPGTALALTPEAEVEYVTLDPYSAIENFGPLNGKDVKKEYRLDRTLDVAYGKVYKFIQINNGYEVFGSELAVSVDKEGKVLSILGDYLPIPEIHENLLMSEAMSIVSDLHSGANILSAEKKIFAYNHAPELSYDIITSANGGLRYFVSAASGEVLLSCAANLSDLMSKQIDDYGKEIEVNIEYVAKEGMYYLADDLRNIYVVDAKSNTTFGGENYKNETGEGFEPVAVTTYNNVVKAYDFYTDAKNIGKSLHGINGENDDIVNNVEEREEEFPIFVVMHYGNNFANLAGQFTNNRAYILVGDGTVNGSIYPLGRALDVIGHEYQHTITQYLVDFVYEGDAGAINEAISDIFGALIEGHDLTDDDFWAIAEDVMGEGQPALRSIKSKVGTSIQYYTMDEKFVCTINHNHGTSSVCDYNGVHRNSTIISHLQYLLYEQMPQYFTKERIGTLWYTTLCNLTSTATFEDFAFTFLQSASNLGFSNEAINTIYTTLSNGKLLPSNAHKVTFVYEDGSVMSTTWVRDGAAVPYLTNPQREATAQYEYEFTGWESAPETVTSDITVKANFNAVLRSYTVTLISGGEIYTTQSIKYGENMELPKLSASDAPEPGQSFKGWYHDADCTTKAQSSVKISGEITFYAKWDDKKSGCGTIVFTGGSAGTGLMLLSVMVLLCLAVILTHKKKVTE